MDNQYADTQEQLIALLNQKNTLPIEITADNVLFSPGTPVDGGLVEVGVRGVQDGGYRKTPVRVRYARIDIGQLFQGVTPELTTLSRKSLHRLLPRFNAILGTTFTTDDIEDIDFIPYEREVIVNVVFKAKATSRYYQGDVSIIFNRRWLLLNEVVNPYVGGLSHPDPVVEGAVSVGLLTWGLDFTPIRDQLGVDSRAANYRGDWSDITAFRAALATEYGIRDWPANVDSSDGEASVRVYDTRDVPQANQDFQRVVIQSNIRYREYVGTAYFHYNLP